MNPSKIKTFYRQNLPHKQYIGATFFVTFRLKDSLPLAVLEKLKLSHEKKIIEIKNNKKINEKDIDEVLGIERDRYFTKYDEALDHIKSGPHFLKTPEVADVIKTELHRFDGKLYDLLAYCIMSNHVHILIDTSIQFPDEIEKIITDSYDFEPLQNIMKKLKGPSAIYANRLLNRKGSFWQRESYDRFIRNKKELGSYVSYILQNPVKAKLVKNWEEYPHSYWKAKEL